MMFTKEDLIQAYITGASTGEYYLCFHSDKPVREMIEEAADLYAALEFERRTRSKPPGAQPRPQFVSPLQAGSPLTGNGPAGSQNSSPYLPPNGTREEVLARALASLMWRTHQAFTDPMTAHTWFTDAWYWPTMNSLRNAFPTLGALEDARVEEPV